MHMQLSLENRMSSGYKSDQVLPASAGQFKIRMGIGFANGFLACSLDGWCRHLELENKIARFHWIGCW